MASYSMLDNKIHQAALHCMHLPVYRALPGDSLPPANPVPDNVILKLLHSIGSHLTLTLEEDAYLKQIVGKLKPPIHDILTFAARV
jgi:hypothetical protein